MQYALQNALSFSIGITFTISTLILAFICLFLSRKRSGFDKYSILFFGFGLLFFFGAHAGWTYRSATIPGQVVLFMIFPYWQWFWILSMLGITFIGLWSVFLNYSEWFETKKWILILIFIPWLIVIVDLLFIANPATAELACSGLIADIRPDIFVILLVGLSLTLFVVLALGYYYKQLRKQEQRLILFLMMFGLLLVLVGGLAETRIINICPVITLGRVIMLLGLWLISYGVIFSPISNASIKSEI
ncbi:MAG: hypothetical protein ACFFDU_01020 [Candidatus Thorarchaeota archaeon]